MSTKIINENIMNQNVIDREELIEYLTWIKEMELVEEFYQKSCFIQKNPDIDTFLEYLKNQVFDTMIHINYLEDYLRENERWKDEDDYLYYVLENDFEYVIDPDEGPGCGFFGNDFVIEC